MLLPLAIILAATSACLAQRCKTTMDCPAFSSCINIQDLDAGQCMCEFDGVQDHLDKCKQSVEGVRRRQQNGLSDVEVSQAKASDPCPNLFDAPSPQFAQCNNGGKCYAYNSTVSFCICQEGYSQRTCDVTLTLDKSSAFYKQGYSAMENRRMIGARFDHIVFARYFTDDIERCMYICRASGDVCQAVNYGRYSVVLEQPKICELLSVKAETEYDLLWRFLIFDANWQYAYKINDNNVRNNKGYIVADQNAPVAGNGVAGAGAGASAGAGAGVATPFPPAPQEPQQQSTVIVQTEYVTEIVTETVTATQ